MQKTKDAVSRPSLLRPARPVHGAAFWAVCSALHPIREAITRLPDPGFLISAGAALGPPYRDNLEELRRDGITRVSGQISPETLADLQRAFQNFVARVDAKGGVDSPSENDPAVMEESYSAQSRQYTSHEPFAMSRALLEICLRPTLVSLINCYLGKTSYITQGVAVRIQPNPVTGFGSFQWHHDAWGKRIKMMIILTEVGVGDQYMTYAKGSHRLRHSFRKYVNSRINAEEFAERCSGLQVLDCHAKPGDIYIFDTNGVHSGNRTSGRTRDTITLAYTRMAHTIWAHRIPAEFLIGFSDTQLEPLRWILRQDRRERPLAPPVNSWVDQLPHLGKWLL